MAQSIGAQANTAAAGSTQREPSMEEILASIRRIIEDSDGGRPEAGANDAGNSGSPGEAAAAPSNATAGSETGTGEGASVDAPGGEVATFRAAFGNAGLDAAQAAGAEPESAAEAESVVESVAATGDARRPGAMTSLAGERASFAAPGEDEPEVPRPAEGGEATPGPAAATTPSLQEAELSPAWPGTAPGAPDETNAGTGERQPAPDEDDAARQPRPAILSDRAERQVAAAFGELNEALEANRRMSLDQMAEEMLRPMLQEWLDNNLPTLVERLVREEIERVARGG